MIAWFLAAYGRRDRVPGRPGRYCAMDDFTGQILPDGAWTESEVLGNHAIVKVRADAATIDAIKADARMFFIPAVMLDESLSSLTAAQRASLRDKIISLGYSADEVTAALGSNLGTRTLGEVLRFIATRRRKPRFDAATDTIVLDGEVQTPRPVESVDAEVT